MKESSHPPSLSSTAIIHDEPDDDDALKIFVSRVPTKFTEDSVRQLMEKHIGIGCVKDVQLIYNHNDKDALTTENISEQDNECATTTHRGFGFITMINLEFYHLAIQKGTLRVNLANKRKRAMYLRPVIRKEKKEDEDEKDDGVLDSDPNPSKNICFLWTEHRCPYGLTCKFEHSGPGSCRIVSTIHQDNTSSSDSTLKKKGKCFSFKKTGKCKLGEACPFRHVRKTPKATDAIESDPTSIQKKRKTLVDTTGKEEVVDKSIKKQKRDKVPQPLSIRVFGLNYDTTEKDVRKFFEPCGTIREISFPVFEDSGRSKGYCGVWFTSPKAVQKACEELDGKELLGRWLRVQAGKMFLRKWEEMEKTNKETKKK